MKRYFLVDYENVHEKGIEQISLLGKRDVVYIFYSSQQKMYINMFLKLKKRKRVHFIDTSGVDIHNGLDFVLCEKVGEIFHKNKKKETKIIIISKDKGYTALNTICNDIHQIFFASNIGEYLDSQIKNKGICENKQNNQKIITSDVENMSLNTDESASKDAMIKIISEHSDSEQDEFENFLRDCTVKCCYRTDDSPLVARWFQESESIELFTQKMIQEKGKTGSNISNTIKAKYDKLERRVKLHGNTDYKDYYMNGVNRSRSQFIVENQKKIKKIINESNGEIDFFKQILKNYNSKAATILERISAA